MNHGLNVHYLTLALILLTVNAASAGNLTREEMPQRVTKATYHQQAPRLPVAVPTPVRNLLDARESENNARKVRSNLSWSSSLADAKQRAREQGKMIFWVHMLGKLDGAT